jgi:hypothetical protein
MLRMIEGLGTVNARENRRLSQLQTQLPARDNDAPRPKLQIAIRQDAADIPNRLMDFPIHVTVRDYKGKVLPRILTRHSHSMSDYFMNYESYLEDCGAVSFGRIGDALVRVCDAVKCTHAIARLWKNADHDLCEKNEVLDFEKLLK